MRRCQALLVLALLLSTAAPLRAQSEDGTQPGYTLHVYANRLQVPTLVLDNVGKPVPRLTRDRFQISLDEGPHFTPTLVRLEGQDPITLSILMDASGDQATMLPRLTDALTHLPAAAALLPHDHVSVYAMDCALVRSLLDIPYNSVTITRAISSALQMHTLHGQEQKPACRRSLRLYDDIAHIVLQMGQLPGRRLLLVLSEGRDADSKISFQDLVHFTIKSGVAVFGIRDKSTHDGYREMPADTSDSHRSSHSDHADPLATLCRSTGGLIFSVPPMGMAATMSTIFTDARSRYILEFPRPDSEEGGNHSIAVFVPSVYNPTVLTTGLSAPLPDPAILTDPNTVHTAPSPAIYGSHRPAN
jgi:VWFA-related protein